MNLREKKIMEVAYSLFKQHGIRSTSLQQVARACGTNLGKNNLFFKSKKELVLAVVKHTLFKKTSYLIINSSLSPSAVIELNNFFKFIEDTMMEFGNEMLTELRKYHPIALDQLRDLFDNWLIPYLQKNIERGLNEGFYRNELDSEQYASTYFFIIRTVLENEVDWNELKKAISCLNDIFLHGALNVKGMRIFWMKGTIQFNETK